MGSVMVYVGNFITGEVDHAVVANDDGVISSTIEGFKKDLGWEETVFALYNMAQDEDLREIQFNNYLDSAYNDYVAYAAS